MWTITVDRLNLRCIDNAVEDYIQEGILTEF